MVRPAFLAAGALLLASASPVAARGGHHGGDGRAVPLTGFSQSQSAVTTTSGDGQATTRVSRQTSFDTLAGGSGTATSFRSVTLDTAGRVVSSISSSTASFQGPTAATVASAPVAIVAFPGGGLTVVSRATVLSSGAVATGADPATLLGPGSSFTTVASAGSGGTPLRSAAPGTVLGAEGTPLLVSRAILR